VESNLSKIGKSSSQKENPSVVSWIDSKTIQKKKALIYLSRHIAKSFLQEKFKIWKKKFEKKNSDANAQQLCSKYRNFANEQLEQQSFSLFWSKHEKQTISFLNFYALSYFFLNKMNSTYCERTFPLGINSESKMQNQVRINDALPRQNIRNLLLSWKLALNQVEQNRSIQTEEGEPAIPNTKSTDFYFSNIYGTLSQSFQSSVTFNPIKVKNVYQSASLLAQEIACKLEQKKSFRFICRTIFQQNSSYKYIKGIRITCSGRLNGAEIAKTECKKFGETSLHVFSEKMDYAFAKASTPYGILGVKVWISYF
jgi:ribosomal protein S3